MTDIKESLILMIQNEEEKNKTTTIKEGTKDRILQKNNILIDTEKNKGKNIVIGIHDTNVKDKISDDIQKIEEQKKIT